MSGYSNLALNWTETKEATGGYLFLVISTILKSVFFDWGSFSEVISVLVLKIETLSTDHQKIT